MNNNVAFIVPTTSRNRNWKNVADSDLYKTLLTSLDRYTPHLGITIFIGFDKDDPLFSIFEQRQKINAVFSKFKVIWRQLEPDHGNVVKAWNHLANVAIFEGFEYIMVLGDDIKMPNDNCWLRVFQKRLKSQNNVGWSAGWSNNDQIATQFLIHKTHIDIFGFVFPPALTNWFCDNWMNDIYPDKWKSWFKSYPLLNTGGDPRYIPLNDKVLAERLVKRHRPSLNRFLNQSR